MRILELCASFGKLSNETFRFEEGMNILTLPNEGGKSTLSALILAMLYGISTSEKNTKDRLADKNRYLPWSGAPMSGKMIVLHDGRRIVIERMQGKAGAMQGFSAYFADSNEEVPYLTAQNCGEVLCSMGREAYERSAFISRDVLTAHGGSAELERRVQSLASTGEETSSYTEARERLERFRKDIFVNKSNGELSKVRREIEELDGKIERLRELGVKVTELHASALNLAAKRDGLEKEIESSEQFERFEKGKRLHAAGEECEKYGLESEGFWQKTPFAALLPERSLYERLAEEKAGFAQAKALLEKSAARVSEAKGERDAAAKQASAAEAALKSAASAPLFSGVRLIMLIGALAVLAVSLGVSIFGGSAGVFWPALAAALLSAVFVGFLIVSGKARRKNAAGRTFSEREIRKNLLKQSEERLSREQTELESARTEQARRLERFQMLLIGSGIRIAGEEDMEKTIRAFANALSEREQALRRFEMAREKYNALKEEFGDGPIEKEAPEGIKPEVSTEEMRRRLSAVSMEYERSMRESAQASGHMEAIGSLTELLSRREEFLELKAKLEGQLEEVNLALSMLSEANEELMSRFAPELSRAASAIFSEITGNRYESVIIRQKFEMLCSAGGADAMHSILELSTGTVDQLYFALRLALCRIMLPEGKTAPIVLDDAFANFDDARLDAALRLLYKFAEEHQVILLTCHKREAERAGDKNFLQSMAFCNRIE